MLAEIYMLRLESDCAGGQGSGDQFVSVRPRLVAGSEGVLTRQAILPLPAWPTPSRHPSFSKLRLGFLQSHRITRR